jgi:hypothetical protein
VESFFKHFFKHKEIQLWKFLVLKDLHQTTMNPKDNHGSEKFDFNVWACSQRIRRISA